MTEAWVPLPLDKPLFANLDPDATIAFQTAIENGFINELGGHTRFPGLKPFVTLPGNGRVYLSEFDGDLIAADSDGQVYRIQRTGVAQNVTGVPLEGGGRAVFAQTDQALLIAAGGPIVRLRAAVTELLSTEAPLATHVGWLDNFTIAAEIDSGLFFQSTAGEPDTWNPLDSFAADTNPDNINTMIVTPNREVVIGGGRSIELWERQVTGTTAFYRRWGIGGGTKYAYTILYANNAVWTIDKFGKLVMLAGQRADPVSDEIQRLLDAIDDPSDAWLGGYPDSPLHFVGHEFLLLQFPNATNEYGTKGVTLLYNMRAKQFSSLYGWDTTLGLPTRYVAWSHWSIWNRTFIGGEGQIYELTSDTYYHAGNISRWLVRTSHLAQTTSLIINAFRLRVRRGLGDSNAAPAQIRVRCSRDSRPFGPWISRTLGKAGERLQFLEFGCFGAGSSFRWEISCTDDCPVDLIGAEIKSEPLGH